jgi:hypothetical protein
MAMNDELLKKHFNFDEADLFANRNGTLTPKQQTYLAKSMKSARKGYRVIGIILLCVAFLPSLILVLAGAPWLFLLIWTLVWGSIWGLLGFSSIRTGLSTSTEARLNRVEGPINIVKVEHMDSDQHRTYEYELHIGGVSFDVESELADIMMQGDIYAIYYLEGPEAIISKEILSVERLAEGK